MAAISRNKVLYVLDDDTKEYLPFYDVKDEIFLTADINQNAFDYSHYCRAIESPTSLKVIKMYLLNDDESINKDVSEYVINASVNFNHQQGQTREADVTVVNNDGFWAISPINQILWRGIKYRIDAGLYYDGTIYWKRCGIYSPGEPSYNTNAKTISMHMYDKFALLDGTISGKQPYKLKIPVGTKIKTAIKMCLSMERRHGEVYDSKDIIFPIEYENRVTSYTISQDEDVSLGEIIIELAEMIFCDVCYNDYGNLVVSNGVDSIHFETKPILWHYRGDSLFYTDPETTIKFTEFVNKVIVRGAIGSGTQYYGEAVNDNPKSQTSILLNDTHTYQMTDTKIVGNTFCQNRAKYELKSRTMLGLQTKFKSIFIPHLLQNEFVRWDNEELNIYNKRFIIKSISIDLTGTLLMDISLCNVDEICL